MEALGTSIDLELVSEDVLEYAGLSLFSGASHGCGLHWGRPTGTAMSVAGLLGPSAQRSGFAADQWALDL